MAELNTQPRLVSLDVFRGITIAAMTLVNNPGSWDHIYWPLEHAEWNGLTPTDWIFPFFLFIVGVAIPISLGKRVEAGGVDRSVYFKIISRGLVIYLLGLAVSVVPFFNYGETTAPDCAKMLVWFLFAGSLFFLLWRRWYWGALLATAGCIVLIALQLSGYTISLYHYNTIRILGVLERIGICYMIASIIFLNTNWKQQIGISIVLLLGYWCVLTNFQVPGCEITTMNDKACNIAAYIDRSILGENHLWRQAKVYDPEGILSTIPAIVTCLIGVLTGTWLTRKDEEASESGGMLANPYRKVAGILFFGVVLLALGWIWNSFFPFNKALWTSSFVLVTAGLGLLMLGCCYWLIDIKGYKAWAKPFIVFGTNAIALYVFSDYFTRMIEAYHLVGADGERLSLAGWSMRNIFDVFFSPINASLAFAITFVLIWLFFMWLLYRKNIYIRV